MILKFKTILATSVASAVLAAAAAASAQDGSAEVGEVVVTAQKRSERLLDVPMSISATSGEQLANAGIGSTGDLQQISPGLVTVNNGLAFTPAIRGVSSVGTSPGDEANVAVYLDDVNLGSGIPGLFEMKDIERVEVLKGPQGTLFGRNATGGAIRIVTLAPSFTMRGEVSADYGFEFNQIKLGAYLTGPLSDSVAGSISLFHVNDDGYIKGVGPIAAGKKFGDIESYSARAKLLFKPSDTFQATAAVDYSWKDDDKIFILAPRNGLTTFGSTPGVVLPKALEWSGSTNPIVEVEGFGASLDATWDPSDAVTVRSITAWRNAKGLYQTDADRVNLSVSSLRLSQRQRNFSQEFNVSGPSDQKLTWLLGAYYYNALATLPYFNSYIGDGPNAPFAVSFRSSVHTQSYSAFGDLTYNVTDQLHLTAGARYTSESKRYKYVDLFRAAGIRSVSDKTTWESSTFRGVVRYDIAQDFNVYGSVSTGFKSGGYNAYALPAIPVHPEKITAFEVGTKARVNGITFTAAAFDYSYKDIQVQGQTLIGQVFVITLANAARAKIRGFELSADGPLTDELSFNVGVSALPAAKYSSFTRSQVFIPNSSGGAANVVPYDASGSRIIRAPKWQANARLTYKTDIAGGEFIGTVNYSYNDGFYWQPGNFTPEASYGIVNARIAWTEPKGRLTYSVWVENLTDEIYSIYTPTGTTGIVDAYAPPRQIGVGIAAKF